MKNNNSYPEKKELRKFMNTRHRWGKIWQTIFQLSTVVGIIALMALLYNIFVGAFGYVVVQNKIDPETLVMAVEENRMLNATNVATSEDDKELVKGISNNPNAIGFFGYAYYQNNFDKLKVISVGGVKPSNQTVEDGSYLLTRPLFIYATDKTMQKKPEVAQFVNFYLTNVNDVIEEVGYFPLSESTLNGTKQQWVVANKIPNQAANQIIELPPVNPAELLGDGEVTIAGSSTVYPLSREMLKMFRQAGYAGTVKIDQVGSTEGFRSFCKSGGIDIANASRLINRAELEACRQANLGEVMAFQIGNDAIAVVVSQQNQFLENVTVEELRQIFTGAEKWSDVNSAWPAEPITRLIPGANSGTLDFFSETVFNRELSELPADTLIAILEKNLSKGLIRRFESEQPLADRSVDELYELVQNKVLEPQIVKSWQLRESLFNRAEIQAYADTVPNGRLEWQNWLHIGFLTMPQSSVPEFAGVRTALIGTLWTVFITIFVALPVGVGAAIYLEEYASHVRNRHMRRLNTVIQTNINNLAGVPSIIYGMLGLAIFVRLLETFTSGAVFGSVASTTANGRTILSAGMTLALLILPLIIINAQEAIRAVPNSLRQAGMALGATKWQTIWHHVLPAAVPGILTGNILAMSRAIGETAPLVVIGASTFITVDPSGLFSKFTTLPIQIYQWTSRPQDEFRNIAAAAIIVLLILLLFLNATAVVLRNHYTRRI